MNDTKFNAIALEMVERSGATNCFGCSTPINEFEGKEDSLVCPKCGHVYTEFGYTAVKGVTYLDNKNKPVNWKSYNDNKIYEEESAKPQVV